MANDEMGGADETIAQQIMGWPQWTDLDSDYDGPYPMFAEWGSDAGLAVYEDESTGDVTRYFSPSTDLNDAAEMEAKIAEMGLAERYGEMLARLSLGEFYPPDGRFGVDDVFAIANASPMQRCKAALKVAPGGEGGLYGT